MPARLILLLFAALLATISLPARGQADEPADDGQATPSVPASVSASLSPASVQVSVDRQTYAPGDTVTVTVTNLGPSQIMPRGGRVCDDLWPISLEQQDIDGWHTVPPPQNAICAGASVSPYDPGESLTKTFVAGPDVGTYRVSFAYDIPGDSYGTLAPVYSDPFSVQN